MNRLISLIDFSETSLNALEFATGLSASLHSDLTVAYIFTEEEFNKIIDHNDPGDLNSLENEAMSKLNAMATDINKRRKEIGLPAVRCLVESGHFTEKVVEVIDREQPDLIVMGTNGAGDIIESWLGSSSTRVVELSDCPVLIVPFNAQFDSLSKIVFASNFEDNELDALSQLIEITDQSKASLTILHLHENENEPDDDKKYKIREMAENKDVNIETRSYDGNLTLAIDEYMNENDSDLLVLVKTQKNLIERLFNPSITRKMAYLVNYPLLVFKTS